MKDENVTKAENVKLDACRQRSLSSRVHRPLNTLRRQLPCPTVA